MKLSTTAYNRLAAKRGLPPLKSLPGARPQARRPDGFDSLTEARWAKEGTLQLLAFTDIRVKLQSYHPFVLALPGGIQYTPDFICLMSNDEHWLIEVKGSYKLGSNGY